MKTCVKVLAAGIIGVVVVAPSVFGVISEPIRVEGGLISGTPAWAYGVRLYRGIPFAAPPVGNLRWRPPQPVVPWEGVRAADRFSPACMQLPRPQDSAGWMDGLVPISEDCLYLNVWTPAKAANDRLPVMVWLYPGAWRVNSAAIPLWDGSSLAKTGVVVVSPNYRLNVFGFLRLKDITQGRIPSTGNEGILDQVAALKWVRDNIETFGGDPSNVTIFGQSAGGSSVCGLLSMPGAKGLFHKAICQSGSAHFPQQRNEANNYSEYFLRQLGVKGNDSSALIALPMERVLGAYEESLTLRKSVRGPMPVVDGEVFLAPPIERIKEGSADGIPLMAGMTTEEMRILQVNDPMIKDLVEGHMFGRFRKLMPDWDMTATVEAYRKLLVRRGLPTMPTELYMAIISARSFFIPTTRMLEVHRRRHNPAYCYLFTWQSHSSGMTLGACHLMELGFLFGTYQTDFFGSRRLADALSRRMQDAWATFARTGNPSCEEVGEWPVYGKRRETMIFGEERRTENAPLEEERLIWDSTPDSMFGW